MKIKSKIFILTAAVVCGLAMLTSCNENTPSRHGGSDDDDDRDGGGGGGGSTLALTVREMKVNVVGEDVKKNAPYIRASVECCDWIILDVMHDGLSKEDSRSFVCLNQKDQLGYYLYATPTTTIISEFKDDINENLRYGNVVYMSAEGDYTRCAIVNSLLENPTILSDALLPHKPDNYNPAGDTGNGGNNEGGNGGNEGGNEGGNGGNQGGGNGGSGGGIGGIGFAPKHSTRDTYGEEIYNIIARHFRDGAEDIQEKTGWLGFSLSRTDALVSVLTSAAFGLSLKQITDYNPDVAENLTEEINENNQFFIKMYLKSLPYVSFTTNVLGLIRDHTIIGALWRDHNEIQETTDDDGDAYVTYPMFSSSRMVDERYQTKVVVVENEKPEYAISLTKNDVQETSASFSVRIENIAGNMPFISSMKLIAEPVGSGSASEVDFFDMSAQLTVSNLMPLTKYNAQVQIYAAGRSYTSNIVPFMTKGALELYPSSLHFPAKGGSRGVAIKNLSYDQVATLKVVGPEWCKIETSTSSFFVDVEASKQKRTGTIDVFVTLNDDRHTQVYGNMPVTQEDSELTWDGTKWLFHGNFSGTIEGKTISSEGDITIEVNSVENNDFSVTSQGQTIIQRGTVSVNESNQLVIEGDYSMHNPDVGTLNLHSTITATRLTETTASAYFSGRATLDGLSENISAHLDGTLIEE